MFQTISLPMPVLQFGVGRAKGLFSDMPTSLHGTPIVYDLLTGDFMNKFEKYVYLTYVTQAGENENMAVNT